MTQSCLSDINRWRGWFGPRQCEKSQKWETWQQPNRAGQNQVISCQDCVWTGPKAPGIQTSPECGSVPTRTGQCWTGPTATTLTKHPRVSAGHRLLPRQSIPTGQSAPGLRQDPDTRLHRDTDTRLWGNPDTRLWGHTNPWVWSSSWDRSRIHPNTRHSCYTDPLPCGSDQLHACSSQSYPSHGIGEDVPTSLLYLSWTSCWQNLLPPWGSSSTPSPSILGEHPVWTTFSRTACVIPTPGTGGRWHTSQGPGPQWVDDCPT